MRAMNLYLLSRAAGGEGFSRLAQELDGSAYCKEYSRHEALSLRCLIDALSPVLKEKAEGAPAAWISLLDGFYFSYTIAHISKEFDLLKLSADGGSILNIELKSEEIEEGRIRKQLEQGQDPVRELEQLLQEQPEIILLCDEVGMGIVPMDKKDREYREAVGRTMCVAAQKAEKVYRVICGIGEKIK